MIYGRTAKHCSFNLLPSHSYMDSSNDTGKQSLREHATHFCNEHPKQKLGDTAISKTVLHPTGWGTEAQILVGTPHCGTLTHPLPGRIKGNPEVSFLPFSFFLSFFPCDRWATPTWIYVCNHLCCNWQPGIWVTNQINWSFLWGKM